MRITPPIAVPWPSMQPTAVEVKAEQLKTEKVQEAGRAQHVQRIKDYEEYQYWRGLGRHVDVRV